MYNKGQRIIARITDVRDIPGIGVTYSIESGDCTGQIANGSVLQILNEEWFEEHMNPPEEKMYRVHIESDDGDAYDCEKVKSIYLEDGFLCVDIINDKKLRIKLDHILYYEMVPQEKECDNGRKE